jgi:hypothetical protein
MKSFFLLQNNDRQSEIMQFTESERHSHAPSTTAFFTSFHFQIAERAFRVIEVLSRRSSLFSGLAQLFTAQHLMDVLDQGSDLDG